MSRLSPHAKRTCSLSALDLEDIADPKSLVPAAETGEDISLNAQRAEQLVLKLKPRDQFIIRSCYGLGEVEADLSAIARCLGVRRQVVSKRRKILIARMKATAPH